MGNHIHRVTEIVGTSGESIDDAIRQAIRRAARSLHGLEWFEVSQIRGNIAEGDVASFQVGLKVGFKLDDPV
jgi:flavin-binding protein dodecin